MRCIGHVLCVSYELHRDLMSYMGWEVHRGSGWGVPMQSLGLAPPAALARAPPDSRCLLSPPPPPAATHRCLLLLPAVADELHGLG